MSRVRAPRGGPSSGRGPRRAAAALACALAWVLPGCRANGGAAPGDLALVPRRPGPDERDALPACLRLVLRATVEADGPLSLALPLPRDDADQVLRVLSVVVDRGAWSVEERDGERLLRVEAPAPVAVTVRAEVERRARDGEPVHPDLAAAAARPDFLEAARARGLEGRWAQGVARAPDGVARLARLPELLQAGVWSPLDPAEGRLVRAPGCVRLGLTSPRATAGGREVPVAATWTLDPVP